MTKSGYSSNKTPEFIPTNIYSNNSQNLNVKPKQNQSLSDSFDERQQNDTITINSKQMQVIQVQPNNNNNYTMALSMSAEELDVHSPPTQYDDTRLFVEAQQTLDTAKELHRIGNIVAAAEKYAQFLHYHRNDVDARIRYALCLLETHKYELSKQQLDSLIECDPQNANNSMLQFVYGLLEHNRRNYNDALQHYFAALQLGYIFPDRIYNNLASLYKQCMNYDEAIKWQINAIQVDNTNYMTYLNYAKILSDPNVNRYDEAIQAFQTAISLQPDLPDLHVEYAVFLMDIKKDYLLAATELNAAHKLSPDNSEIKGLLDQATEFCSNVDNDSGSDQSEEDVDNDDDTKSPTILSFSGEDSEEHENKQEQRDMEQSETLVYDIMAEMQELQFNDYNDKRHHRSTRKQSLPINLPPPTAPNTRSGGIGIMHTISEQMRFLQPHRQIIHSNSNSSSRSDEEDEEDDISRIMRDRSSSPAYTPLRLQPREKSRQSSSKSTRKSICGSLPPPHNPNNPNDPVRRNSLLTMNRSQLDSLLNDENTTMSDGIKHSSVQKNDIDDDAASIVSDLSILSDEQQI